MCRHDPDDGVDDAVEPHRLTEGLCASTEQATPQAMAEHHGRLGSGLVVRHGESTSEDSVGAEYGEEVTGHPLAAKTLDVDTALEGGCRPPDRRESVDLGRAVAQVVEVARRHVAAQVAPVHAAVPDVDQALRFGEVEGSEEDAVNDTEDRCVGADAQGQGRDRDCGEHRAAP